MEKKREEEGKGPKADRRTEFIARVVVTCRPRRLLEESVEQAGYVVISCCSGKQRKSSLIRNNPSLDSYTVAINPPSASLRRCYPQ